MLPFLRNFDRLSFWLGFLTATLFWFLLRALRPVAARARQMMKESAETARSGVLATTEVRHNNDTLQRAQAMHLAAPLFSLEEILIEPRLLAPPPRLDPGQAPPPEDIVESVLPYLPDNPQLAAIYGAPTLTLAEALQGDANLVLLGEAGAGKTVALAHLATKVAYHDSSTGVLSTFVPFLLHAADLDLSTAETEKPLDTLLEALKAHASTLTLARLPAFVQAVFEQGRALLLLDGMDELTPPAFKERVDFIEQLLQVYPQTRMVIAASPYYFDGLTTRLGFAPVALSTWQPDQLTAFVQRWSDLWSRFVVTTSTNGSQAAQPAGDIDPALLNAWLLEDIAFFSPLELCLKVWAAYAGDSLGPGAPQAIEAYLRRMTDGIDKGRQALEQFAAQMVLTQTPLPTRSEAQNWVAQWDVPAGAAVAMPAYAAQPAAQAVFTNLEPADEQPALSGQTEITVDRVLPALENSGLLQVHPSKHLRLAHPVLAGYLAAGALNGRHLPQLLDGPVWEIGDQALHYLTAGLATGQMILDYVQEAEADPLQRPLLQAGRWLKDEAQPNDWQSQVVRKLVDLLLDDKLPAGQRARALSALVRMHSAGLTVLLRKVQGAPDSVMRQLAALGSGALRDFKAVPSLTALLGDPTPNVRRAACLALVAIGNKDALEAIASALLNADDDLRRTAAEALANHPEEGYPTLQEGATLDDVLVRRAVVYGLARVRQRWARELLEKMQVEETQWVVQNAATQALERLDQSGVRAPQSFPPLSDTPWLIAFAGEQGMGIAPGKPAYDLLYQALKQGNEEQQLAALDYLQRWGDEGAVLPVYQVYFTTKGEVREAALDTLWRLSGGGIELPAPQQFGL